MQWILLIIGAILGASISNSFLASFIGAILGALIGLNILLSKSIRTQKQLTLGLQALKKELQDLKSTQPQEPTNTTVKEQTQIAEIEHAPTTPPNTTQKDQQLEITPEPVIIASSQSILTEAHKADTITKEAIANNINPTITTPSKTQTRQKEHPVSLSKKIPLANPKPLSQPKQQHFLNTLYNKARDWLLGGNTILKAGAIILFLGLAFLLRYATEGMSFPIEARYIAVALGGCAMLGLGWYLRKAAHNYGLILQGTGVAILYLTSYASMYLHQLLPPNIIFVFLLLFTVLAALLSIFQNALSLAIAATLGGFAAPVLASSGGGNHVAFFCYLLVLNAGILSIAWFKAWHPLNLIGFIGTFGMGFAWGIKTYTPSMFWSTEPFLIIFFLLYIAIALLFARRKLYEKEHAPDTRQILLNWSIKQTSYLDATLIFGTPIVGFGLQCTLVQHLTNGAAISALILGIFYLTQAFIFYRYGSKRVTLLMETNLALGVIFTTLAIPLYFDAQWTSASWALEAAGVFWISLKQHRKMGQFFSSFLLYAASLSYLSELGSGNNTLLEGSSFGAILLAISYLFSLFQALKHQEALKTPEKIFFPLFASLSCGFFYLIAPLNLMHQETAICWVVMSFITVLIGKQIKLPVIFNNSLFIQLLAIILFISQLSFSQLGAGFNTASYLFVLCFVFGGLLIANTLFIIANNRENNLTIDSSHLLRIILLSGLTITHLAPLFVLPWLWVACLWAVMGYFMAYIAKRFSNTLCLYFSLALSIVAIITFFTNNTLATPIVQLFNINFITLMAISISVIAMAWQIKHTLTLTIPTNTLENISRALLLVGVISWCIAFTVNINALVPAPYQDTIFLLTIAISLLITGIFAKHLQWQDFSMVQLLLTPIAFIILNQNFFYPLSHFGWFAWAVLIIVHFFNLKRLENLIPRNPLLFCHMTGLWLIIIVLSCFSSQLLQKLTVNTAWNWLVWMIIPSLWLIIILRHKSLPWPIKNFKTTYSYAASIPIAAYLFAWYWLANTYSTGAISFIPYIPLFNPLELGLLVALISCIYWLMHYQKHLPIQLPSSFTKGLLAISLFALSTAAVFRFAFNWLGIPFHFDDQVHSMTVQASLSILWTIIALGLMIMGHQKIHRELWIIGASLITLVVVKLFFVELGNSGSLARIISFTIVGLLLLIVGYFAPLPPKQKETK